MDGIVQRAMIIIVLFMVTMLFLTLALPRPQGQLPANTPNKITLDSYFQAANILVAQSSSPLTSLYSAYTATTLQQQEQGYMNQTSIGDCNGLPSCLGMLFIFKNQSEQCFWMANTQIPLEQSWISNQGIVTYVYNASPYSTKSICADGTMVLETAPGKIRTGEFVELGNQS
jgi:uncharacterized membrane protein (UPF0127 family)